MTAAAGGRRRTVNPEPSIQTRSRRLGFGLLVLTAASVLTGCGVRQARTVAVTKAESVRELLNAHSYAEIYASASPQFQQTGSRDRWVAFCGETARKLGEWKASTLKDTQVIIMDSGGYLVHVVYETEFANGRAAEMISVVVHGQTIALVGYNLDSPLLVPQPGRGAAGV
jgi:hypothetical protein